MEILKGIHRVDEASSNMAHSNVYLVIDGNSLTVIDTGTAGNAKKIAEYIQKIGQQPTDVATIVITHYHVDHTGSLEELQKLTNAKVAVHEADADFVAGNKPYPKPKGLLIRAVSSFIKLKTVPVDIVLKDGDKISNLTVIHTPGHSPGSIALLNAVKKVLFVGDTLRLDGEKVTRGPEGFNWDTEQETESIKKIAALDFDVMLPGHGELLTANASTLVKDYAKTIANSL
jgi:glyoxylase-like metal-dependent hydrolase (beta-lactamase superfamily II)